MIDAKHLLALAEGHEKECCLHTNPNGLCATRRCLIRGGWNPELKSTDFYSLSTCEAHETATALRELAAQRMSKTSGIAQRPRDQIYDAVLKELETKHRMPTSVTLAIKITDAILALTSTDRKCWCGISSAGRCAVCGTVASSSTSGCICQEQHRRGYCKEPGCPYALTSTERK